MSRSSQPATRVALWTEVIEDFRLLQESYEHAGILTSAAGDEPGKTSQHSPAGDSGRLLLLCAGLLRNTAGKLFANDNSRPPHIAVFGGTQVGKSTCINAVLGTRAARVHHTAGFTRHAQGFVSASLNAADVFGQNPHAFSRLRRVEPDELSNADLRTYSLEIVQHQQRLMGTVVWDTPDCDAVGSLSYQVGMIEAITAADCLVYVTSREKYAVNSILEWLALLLDAGVPVIAVLNMTPAAQQEELKRSMIEALQSVLKRTGIEPAESIRETVAFEFITDGRMERLWATDYAPAAHLSRAVEQCAGESARSFDARAAAALKFISQRLPVVLRPAFDEIAALRTWQETAREVAAQFTENYRREYLDDPQRYDAFAKVGLEILALLDPPIPGLKKSIVLVRHALSLPAQVLIGLAKMGRRALGGDSTPPGDRVPNEVQTFRHAHERLLNEISRRIGHAEAKSGRHPMWEAVGKLWRERLEHLQREFELELQNHRARSEEWVRETAQGIYGELAKSPVKLNMLRTGRVGADAAAIVISIKTGGAGDIIHDIVLAPVLMSVIEGVSRQLTETYVHAKKAELRERLIDDAARFTETVYVARLDELGREAAAKSAFLQLPQERVESLGERIRQLQDVAGVRR